MNTKIYILQAQFYTDEVGGHEGEREIGRNGREGWREGGRDTYYRCVLHDKLVV